MDRLTHDDWKDPKCQEWAKLANIKMCDEGLRAHLGNCLLRLAAYEDTNLTPDEIAAALSSLAEFDAAERDGRLARLPCKVGTEIFRLVKRHTGRGLGKHSGKEYVFIMRGKMLIDDAMNFGKTVFLTRDEAVAAMKGEGE